jgi:hypothetical protein
LAYSSDHPHCSFGAVGVMETIVGIIALVGGVVFISIGLVLIFG